MGNVIVRVVLEHPVPVLFDYRCDASTSPLPGQLVRVPFGKRYLVGLIWEVTQHSDVPLERLREVDALWAECPPLTAQWRALATFAANYYQRALGEVVLPALPQGVREASRWGRLLAASQIYRILPAGIEALPAALPPQATARRRLAAALHEAGKLTAAAARALHPQAIKLLDAWQQAGWVTQEAETAAQQVEATTATASTVNRLLEAAPELTVEQADVLEAIHGAHGFAPFLLHGVTGSGKTEVYLRALATLLAREPAAQALVLVPEINLTPQFEAFFRARLAAWPTDALVTLHSGLAEGERSRAWLAAHTGRARIVLGTRLAVLASLPRLALIIVDEEHDAAYKQQEKLRYSARDLAIWRAKQLNIPIILGSATPSLETWRHAQLKHYTRLTLTQRAVAEAVLPVTQLIDMSAPKRRSEAGLEGLSTPLLDALRERLACGEQSLIFLNRRGYAPALSCTACGWVAGCVRCSAFLVLHKQERGMRCHHCGWHSRIPHACAECGNVDLAPLGRGTQKLEEALAAALPEARILRIDADSTRRKGSAQALFASVSAGEIDILVGTQMIAKGHDFQRVTLVGVLNADAALFSHDFRASERLFAQLLQASGRAGRAGHGEVLIQTRYPQHPLYQALARHDYVGFAETTLAEREQARLPPFSYQALLRAEARTLEAALTFLARSAAELDALPGTERVTRYEPVPMLIVKVMHVQRAHLLLESTSRSALQSALRAWQPHLQALKIKDVLRWSIEVDPLEF